MKRAYTIHRPIANEYLVRERDRRRLRDLGKILLILAPVALSLSGFTWIHLQVLDAGYAIEALESELHEQGRRESRMRLEAAYLAGPGLVEKRATEELAMSPPALDQLVFLESRSSYPALAATGRAGACLEGSRVDPVGGER